MLKINAPLVTLLVVGLCTQVQAATVSSQANIFGAGLDTLPAPAGGGGGVAPFLIELEAQVTGVQFLDVAGSLKYRSDFTANGPEGIDDTYTQLPDTGALASPIIDKRRFLAGVFIDDSVPSGAAPAALAMPDLTFETLSPELNQIFFIGDGLTGTGAGNIQTFNKPTAATRLYLGFIDGQAPQIGWYGDNSGSVDFTAKTISPVPVPAAVWLFGSALIGLAGLKRNIKK